jgi:hypothetical protein
MSQGQSDWIRRRDAAALLEVPLPNLTPIAEAGGVRILRIPGSRPKYWRPDLIALKERSIVNGPAAELLAEAK